MKQEITNEFRAAAFAAYWGAKCVCWDEYNPELGKQQGVMHEVNKNFICINDGHDIHEVMTSECLLLLKPLSKISDEDVRKLARHIDLYMADVPLPIIIQRDEYSIKAIQVDRCVKIMLVDGSIYASENQNINNDVIDKIREMGYLTTFRGIDLVEAGIAILETE